MESTTASTPDLKGRKIAILATDGFEQVELTQPRDFLIRAGASVHILSPEGDAIQGFNHFDRGERFEADRALGDVSVADYDALVLPGGAHNPDQLRSRDDVRAFVKGFVEAEKPVAAICHAPWVLIDAGVAEGRTLTSYPTLRRDLANAGAEVVDREVVVDGPLITSRDPDDIPAFCAALARSLGGSEEGRQSA